MQSPSPNDGKTEPVSPLAMFLAAARFGLGQGARRSAQSALAGFAVLLFAVVGVGLLT